MTPLREILKKPYLPLSLFNVVRNGTFGDNFNKHFKVQYSDCPGLQDVCPDEQKTKLDVACKVALISGGTSGIGLAAASQILCAGARNVAITGDNVCQGKEAVCFLNNTYGMGKAIYINCNVNCMGSFEDAFKSAVEMYKRIDIVVNAAGICDGPQWEREIVTNVVGTIRGTLLGFRYVGKEGSGHGGCIVNISGAPGLEPFPSAPTLSASQHAIVGLSRSFGDAVHYKKSGVRVVCLCPGFTQTGFIKNIAAKGMTEAMGRLLEAAVRKAKKQGPDPCGHAVVHLIKHGNNGSVWVCEGSRLFLLNIPSRQVYSTLVAQYL